MSGLGPDWHFKFDTLTIGEATEAIRCLTRRSTGPFKTGRLRDGAHVHHSGARS